MKINPKQLAELRAKALASQDGETYRALISDQEARAGVVARRNGERRMIYLLEVSINSEASLVNASSRTGKGSRIIFEEMRREGYLLTFEDGHISTFEKAVLPKELNAEVDRLLLILGDRTNKQP